MTPPSAFDPDAAAQPGSGIFGLPCTRGESSIIIIPVPFDATTSYRPGTARGPEVVLQASAQVDLYDRALGRIYERGIHMLPISGRVSGWSDQGAALARPLIEAGGARESDAGIVARVNAIGDRLNEFVYESARAVLAAGQTPALLGGEHSVSFGAIRACAEHAPGMGVLQVDAHMDLRDSFEGFCWSHASIMHNVLARVPQVGMLVQVGIRDFGEGELEFARAQGERVRTHFDDDWAARLDGGARFSDLCAAALAPLPRDVYVSFDIDGLDPALCPHTGTPVPGGLSFHRAATLLEALHNSGRRIVGFDLVEVAPGPEAAPEWDANVGARLLYKMCGLAAPK